jgi:hypothetical protein
MIQSVLLGVHLAALLDLVSLARCALWSRGRFLASGACGARVTHPRAPLLFLL